MEEPSLEPLLGMNLCKTPYNLRKTSRACTRAVYIQQKNLILVDRSYDAPKLKSLGVPVLQQPYLHIKI